MLAWIAAFDCDFVRLSRKDGLDFEDSGGIDSFFGGSVSRPELHAGIWSVQNTVLDIPGFDLDRCTLWKADSLLSPSGALSLLALDLPHKFARGFGMTVFVISVPFLVMGWCLCCCVMNKATTNFMAGLAFLLSIMTALFSVSPT